MLTISLAVNVFADVDLTGTVDVSGLKVISSGNTTEWTSNAAGTVEWSGQTASSEGCNPTYTAQSATLTLTNESGEEKVLSFNYDLTLNSGSVTIDGEKKDSSGFFQKSLASEGSITISTQSSSSSATTTTIKLSSIKLENPKVTVTFNPSSNGSYTVDGAAITASTAQTNPATKSYTLVAAPAEHYVFQGWYLDGKLYYTGEKLTATFPSGGTISAQFEEDPLYKVATATDAEKDDLVEINSRYYHEATNTLSLSQSNNVTQCYYSVAATTATKDDWDMQYVPFLTWAAAASGGSITATYSGSAQGEWCTGFSNSWINANMVANVIRVKAVKDCLISFEYSNSITPTNSESATSGPYTIVYESTSGTESYSNIRNKGITYRDASGTVERALAQGKYLYICMNGKASDSGLQVTAGYTTKSFTYTGTISNFTVSPNEQKYTQTAVFQDNNGNTLTGGKLNVNGTTYTTTDGSIAPITLPAGQTMKVSVAAAPANYKLLGWSVNGKMLYQTTYEYSLDADTAVNPVFVPNAVTYNPGAGTYQYKNTAGTYVALDGQYIARNTAATSYYSSLEKAFEENNVVVLLANMTIEGNYEIPAGKTLMVPSSMTGAPAWDSTNNWYTPASVTTGRSVYATLTMNGDLTINGKLVVDGGQSTSNGGLAGPYGVLVVKGTVTVNDGAELYGYGVINGTGTIYANSGAQIHELLEIMDIRHPLTLMNITNKASSMRLFPFNSIHIYSIETPVVYQKGATLRGHHCSSYTAQGAFTIISDANAMFLIKDGTVTKSFKDGRMLIRIDEGADVRSGSMKETMTGSFSGVSEDITVDSADYLIPLSSAYHLQVAGNFVFDHSFKMLPGAKMDVLPEGTVTVSKGADLVLYRLNDYDYRRRSSMADTTIPTGFTTVGYPINFSRYSSFKIDTVGSAQLNVDGQVIIQGGLYVTNQLMPEGTEKYTYYNNGYNFLTGSGTIDMSNVTGTLTEIHENLDYGQTTDVQDQTVAVTLIKGLRPDATADVADQYESLAQKNVYYGMINDNGVNVWTTEPCAIRHMLDDGTEAKAATCTEAGNIAYWTCTRCEKMFSDAEGKNEVTDVAVDIDPAAHVYGEPTYTWAEDNSIVTAECVCENNETHKLTETVTPDLETTKAATCVADGVGTYTANFENEAFEDQTKTAAIPATGHNFDYDSGVKTEATCDSPGYVTYTCTNDERHKRRDEFTEPKHTFENGVCSCGVKQAASLFGLAGSNVKAGDSLDFSFYVSNAVLNTDSEYVAVITRTYDYRPQNDKVYETVEIPSDQWIADGSYYRFRYTGIAAKEMADNIYVTIMQVDGGQWTVVSNTAVDSIRIYAMRALNRADSQTPLTKALVDMLNYGAACQTHFDYNTDDLANKDLGEMQNWATVAEAEVKKPDTSAATNFGFASVSAESSLVLTFYFKDVTTGMSANISYTDHYGHEKTLSTTVLGTYVTDDKGAKYYAVDVTGLAVADGRQLVTCTVTDGNGATAAEAAFSVEGYVAITTADDGPVYMKLMKFVDSAYAYFRSLETPAQS